MPVWQQKIKELASNELVVLGVVQEQHAERTRLYKQWRQFDFPIAQDPITKLGLAVVPVFVGIDEYGIVRETKIRPDGLEAFVNQKYDAPEQPAAKLDASVDYGYLAKAESSKENWKLWGDEELMFKPHGDNSYSNAIAAYRLALTADPNDGELLFRLGVAYRKRYDELSQDDAEFDQASICWTKALAQNPNQYIWRRRIEQYGPRQKKPYPFYDWIDDAIAEIRERGEDPIELKVALTQSEMAGRSKPDYEAEFENPDPESKITLDENEYIRVESTLVPGTAKAGEPATMHLRLVPVNAKWNNESEPLKVWIESDDAKLSQRLLDYENSAEANSQENRQLEFDLVVKKGAGECTVRGYALYNVCLEDGVCLYRRQDFEFKVPLGDRQD